MTIMINTINNNIEKYFAEFKNKHNIDINKNDNINTTINNLTSNYNYLSIESKKIFDLALQLFDINKNLEKNLQRCKKEYNLLQKQYMLCKNKLNDIEKQQEEIKEAKTTDNICCICMENPKQCVYVNCGHFCACLECCEQMDLQCPICRHYGKFVKLINV